MKRRGFLGLLASLPVVAAFRPTTPVAVEAIDYTFAEGGIPVESWLSSTVNMAARQQMAMYAAFVDGGSRGYWLTDEGFKTFDVTLDAGNEPDDKA